MRGLVVKPEEVETNIVFFELSPETDMTASVLAERLQKAGVRMGALGRTRIRAVTHLDVSRQDIEATLDIMSQLLQ
jgi:threonine aldolase